ncbi:MAG TPA: class I SAM-dependent methyltransferase [Kofleriaceae bacterium]|nr:class I SAM-dependent methyltransferase [Kofleriaceae bacterium]
MVNEFPEQLPLAIDAALVGEPRHAIQGIDVEARRTSHDSVDGATVERPCGCRGNGPAVWREAGHIGRRCGCGLVYIDPPPPARALGPELHHDGFYAFPAEHRLDWVARWCRSGRLLEVGPGPGHLLAAALRRGYTVAGVDPNPSSVRRIRERLGVEVELATIETSRLPDAAFDAVVHIDLLSHFDDPVAALRAMARRLAPGGHICFEVGLLGGISPAWYRALGRVGFPEHRWLYSREALARVMARAGLAMVGVRRFGLIPVIGLILARRAAGPLAARIAGKRALDGAAPDPDGLPPPQNAAHRLYERALCLLRYRLGPAAPALGPQGVLVAAQVAGRAR